MSIGILDYSEAAYMEHQYRGWDREKFCTECCNDITDVETVYKNICDECALGIEEE